jgi:2,3-bisphosphoglycerate-dependent phosphoglycerate mutase
VSTIAINYVLRHGRTTLSATYKVNGNSTEPIDLDDVGIEQCARLARGATWLDTITTCLTSTFPRARQTADILIGEREVTRIVEPHLDEIDYGAFEGGPWLTYGDWLKMYGPAAIPPDGGESWHAAVDRLLTGLAEVLKHPGPRLVVGHGLLVSLLYALRDTDQPLDGFALPEAPYVEPVVLTDSMLAEVVDKGRSGSP